MDPNTINALLAEVKAAHEQVAGELREAANELRGRAERAEGEAAALRDALAQARIQAAVAEGEVKGLRLALEEARRPFWRRWLG